MNLNDIGRLAKSSYNDLKRYSSEERNLILRRVADYLCDNIDFILAENNIDIENAKAAELKTSFIDRLTLNESRIRSMADGLRQIADLPDPLSETISMQKLPNGLNVAKRRVPLGVIGIIYESRPNVTIDAFGLCLKSGNVTILRGGKEAIYSNSALICVVHEATKSLGFSANVEGFVQLIKNTERETAIQMMKLNEYIDVLIPRGGAGLIRSVVENSTIPVIETGTGNCHIFVDETANLENALNIMINSKTQRPGVCNACETVLIHKNIAEKFVPLMCTALVEKNVKIYGDSNVISIFPEANLATLEDWETEYLDLQLAVGIVDNVHEAIAHIDKYSTGHSEAIITENYTNSQIFLDEVDSAAVYVNASTRFTDGMEFGLGAEIGISTQKLHARGPMGIKELTSIKYVIYGNGQIRK